MSKYGVSSGLHFPVRSPNTGEYGAEKTPFLDTFHAMTLPFLDVLFIRNSDHNHATVYRKETNNDLYYIGIHWRLYLGNVEHSELWSIEPILSASTIIIYSKSKNILNAYFILRMATQCG